MLQLVLKPHRESLQAGSAEPQKLFVMLRVIPTPEAAAARPPVALALLIDTSGSMREYEGRAENKLEYAIRAAHALADDDRLRPEDLLTLVRFDTDAAALLPLSPLADRRAAHQAIESLRGHRGRTYLARGLECVSDALRSLPDQTAKRVLLLTDGEAADEPGCRRIAPAFAKANTPIAAVGIGCEYNEELLLELARATQGRPYHLQAIDDFQQVLNTEVGGTVREVVTDLRATVTTSRGVTLDACTRVYPSLSPALSASQPLRLGNVTAGDFTVFLLEFTLAGFVRPPCRARLAQVQLTGALSGTGREETLPTQDLLASFANEEALGTTVDQEVLAYVHQKNVDRLVQDAARQAGTDAGGARETLHTAARTAQMVGNTAMARLLTSAAQELERDGRLSANMIKTVRTAGRTNTIRADAEVSPALSAEEIRRLSGA